jgi:hypothetical protein
MNKTTLRTTADTWVRVWALPFLAALVIIAGSGVGFAIPSLGGPTGIVALPTADIATENKVDLVLGRQSFNIGDGDNTAWDLKALIGVGGRAELWAAHSRISSDFDSRLTSIGAKLQLMREPQDQASLAVGLGYFSWQDGLLSWVTSLPRATQAKWADSTPLGIRDDVKKLLGLEVPPPAHTLTVAASCNPTNIPLAGGAENPVACSATATDSLGHGVATWQWDDGGAGGGFSDANAQNPTYTASAAPSEEARGITLTVTATCNGSPAVSKSASCQLTQGSLVVTATANPNHVPLTGGAVSCNATFVSTDAVGQGTQSWHWSDGGAGGSFSNANIQSPTYTIPAVGTARVITLTATLTLTTGTASVTGTGTCTVTQSGTHTVTVTADCSPKQVLSAGGPVTCAGSATDNLGHAIASYQWSDGGAGGSFTQPNPALAAATYQVSAYGLYDPRTITLTLTATCAGDGVGAVSGSDTVQITQFGPTKHEVIVTSCTAVPDQVDWQGNPDVTASATAFDSLGHGIATYKWTATPGTGHFVPPGGNGQTVTFVVNALTQYDPARTITLTVTATCNDVSPVSGQGQALISQSAFIPSGTAQVVPIGTRSRAVLGLLPHDSAPRAFGRLAGSLRSPLKPLAQSGLVVTPATVPTLDLLRTEDVKAWNAYIVATKDFTPTTGEAWEERSAANRLLGTAGLYYLKVDPGLGMGFSLTRPFLGFEFISTAGTVVGLEYRFRDNDLDERAVFSAVLRHYFSPEFAGELGTTNASPIGTGLSGQDLFVRVNYSIPIKAVY